MAGSLSKCSKQASDMVNQDNYLVSPKSALKVPSFYTLSEKSDIWPNGNKEPSSLSLDQSFPTANLKGTESSLGLPLLLAFDVTQFLTHPPRPMPLSSLLPRTNLIARKWPTREIKCLCFFSREGCWGFYYHYYYFSVSWTSDRT